jgi:hypothetical protein
MKLLVAILALWMLVPVAQACSCARRTIQQQSNDAELVFAGRVDEVTLIDSGTMWEPRIVVRLSVGRVWKGDVPAALMMHTYFEASSCRGFFRELAREGQELLVFANTASARQWKVKPQPFDAGHVGEVLRQDLVDGLPDATRILTTSICSGSLRWEDANLAVRGLGPYHSPTGALAMNDPPPFDAVPLPPARPGLPQVCWAMREQREWKALEEPPPEGADFEHELRRTPEYKKVMSGSTGQAKDFWWRDDQTGAAGLCRLTHPDPHKCGVLAAIFENGQIVYADSDPCTSGPL